MNKKTYITCQIVLLILLVGLALLTIFNTTSTRLFMKSSKELYDSLVYYFKNIFGVSTSEGTTVTAADVSFLYFDYSILEGIFPEDLEVFGYRFLATWQLMVNGDYISISWGNFINGLTILLNLLLLFGVPVILLIVVYFIRIFRDVPESEGNQISTPLKIFLLLKTKIIKPIKQFLSNLWITFRSTGYIFWPTIIFVLYNLNMWSLILIIIAWYFYFVFSLDFLSIWYLICKFFICISPLLKIYFWPLWVFLIIFAIVRVKINRGYNKLQEMFFKNEEFISDNFGVVTGIYGPPGTGKTTSAVAFATQIEVMLREKARSQLMEIRAEFPEFPFRYLEEEVEDLKLSRKCVNKVQIDYHFENKFKSLNVIYGYDLKTKKNCHYDGLSVADLKHELRDYAQLYFIYISILAYSTYSVRYDEGIELSHAFPGLKYNFFRRDLRLDEDSETNQSYHANILDYNLLRLNGQVEAFYNKDAKDLTPEEKKELDRLVTLFDFGVITISEIAKERGNKDTNRNRNYKSDTNPANDGLANCLGLIRHLTTVRHQQYGFVIWDDQKISALRQVEAAMAETNIFLPKQTNKKKITLPMWFFEGVILEWGLTFNTNLYNKYISYRNDQTLFSYFIFHMYSFFFNLNRKIVNTFGYKKYDLSLSGVNVNGGQESRGESAFYVMDKIVYAGNKFDTAVYSGFFKVLKLQAESGNNESESFKGSTATFQELAKTHGYMFDELGTTMKEYIARNIRTKKERGTKKDQNK